MTTISGPIWLCSGGPTGRAALTIESPFKNEDHEQAIERAYKTWEKGNASKSLDEKEEEFERLQDQIDTAAIVVRARAPPPPHA